MIFTINFSNEGGEIESQQIQFEDTLKDPLIEHKKRLDLFKLDYTRTWTILSNAWISSSYRCQEILEKELQFSNTQMRVKENNFDESQMKQIKLMSSTEEDLIKQAFSQIKALGTLITVIVDQGIILAGTSTGIVYSLVIQNSRREQAVNLQTYVLVQPNGQQMFAYADEFYHHKNFNNSVLHLSISVNSKEEHMVVAGFENGDIVFIDVQKTRVKTFDSKNCGKITLVRKILPNVWVTSDNGGNVYMHQFVRGRFMDDLDSILLLKTEGAPVTTLQLLWSQFQESFFTDSIKGQFKAKQKQESLILKDSKPAQYIVFAMGSENKIWVMRVTTLDTLKRVQLLCDQQRPSRNNTGQWCCLGWTKANKSLYLCVNWGMELTSYCMVRSQNSEGVVYTLKNEGVVKINERLKYIRSANITYLLTQSGKVLVLYSTTQDPKSMLDLQIQIQNVSYDISTKQLYVLSTQGKLITVHEHSFIKEFRRLIENNKIEESQYLLILGRMVNVDVETITESLLLLTSQMLKNVYQLLQLKDFDQAHVEFKKILEFVIPFNDDQTLFIYARSSINAVINDPQKDNFFFNQSLECFIEQNQFIYIPPVELDSLVRHLIKEKKIQLISKLFEQLDLKLIPIDWALEVCINNSLLKPLILICQSCKQWLTPFFKMWSCRQECQFKRDLGGELMFGRQSLAYLLFLMKGNLFISSSIQIKEYIQVVQEATNLIFVPENLSQLIILDAQACFLMLYQLFSLTTLYLIEGFTHKENIQIIQQCVQPHLDDAYKQYFQVVSILRSERRTSQNMFNITEHTFSIQKQYALFLLRLKYELNILKFDFDTIIWLLFYISLNKSFFFEIDIGIFFHAADNNQLILTKTKGIESHLIESFMHEILMNSLVEMAVQQCDKNDEWQCAQLEQLCTNSILLDYPLSQSLLNSIKRDFDKSFNLLIKAQNKLVKHQIFKWLHAKIVELKKNKNNDDISKLNGLSDVIIKNLPELIEMDLQKTQQLIIVQHTQLEQRVIERLDQMPKLQLKYIDYTISLARKSNTEINCNTLKKQIGLLCEIEPNRVLTELKQNDYPLDEVLLIVQKYNNIEAQAFVLERQGAILDAVTMQLGILKEKLDAVLKRINQFDEPEEIEYVEINDKSDLIIEICRRNSTNDGAEDNWYALLDFYVDYLLHFDKTKTHQEILKRKVMINFSQVFEEITMYTQLEVFVDNLKEKYQHLEVGELRYSFIKILDNFSYQQTFLLNIRGVMRKGLTEAMIRNIRLRTHGHFIDMYCELCIKPLKDQDQDVVSFSCGHNFHYDCSIDPAKELCKKCRELDFNIYNFAIQKRNRMNQLTDTFEKKRISMAHPGPVQKKLQIEEREQFNSKKAKLSNFDKLRLNKCDKLIENYQAVKENRFIRF